MENFVVSARKYRPGSFDLVVGQDVITGTLKNAVKSGQLAQAFLFTGPRGVGKTTCARITAKTINCENLSPEGEACNECVSCTSFNESASFNIYELDAASNNSVEDIRSLVDQVRIPPQMGKYKVYIIDEVHMLSSNAFNAFLKTLEEPPAYAKFILATTEKHKILPTILSRCQIYDFKRITVDDIVKHLDWVARKEGLVAETDALHIIAQKADGALRDALSMFDQLVSSSSGHLTYRHVIDNLNVLDYEHYFQLTRQVMANDVSSALITVNELLANGFDGQNILTGLLGHFRNLLIGRTEATLALMEVSPHIAQKYVAMAKIIPAQRLIRCMELLNQADQDYRTSSNKHLLVELAMISLCTSGEPIEAARDYVPPKAVRKESVAETDVLEEKPAAYAKAEKPTAGSQAPEVKAIEPQVPEVAETDTDTVQETAVEPADVPPIEPEPEAVPVTAGSDIPAQPVETEPTKAEVKQKEPVSPAAGKSFLGINIADALNGTVSDKEAEEEATEAPESDLIQEDKPFSQGDLEEHWVGMANTVAADQRNLKASLLCRKPELKGEREIHFLVDNQLQEDELTAKNREIFHYLATHLYNSTISLHIARVEKPHEIKRFFTEEDRFQAMAAKNPALLELKDQLGLDFNATE